MKLIILLLLIPCLANAQYYNTTPYLNNVQSLTDNDILIDSTYSYYIREIYNEKTGDTKQQQTFAQKQDSSKLIEIEYLFISKRYDNVIYIATVPDKYLQYYADTGRYKGANFINVYDFKKIFTGKITAANTFEFKSKNGKDRDVWIMSSSDRNGNPWPTISMIKSYVNGVFDEATPIDEALESDVSFRPVSHFTLYFFRNEKDHHVRALSKDNTIHIQKNNKKYQVWFQFNSLVADGSCKAYFEDTRLQYLPEPLY